MKIKKYYDTSNQKGKLHRLRRFNEAKVSFINIISDMLDNGEIIRELYLSEHKIIYSELSNKREKPSRYDLNYILDLFKESFILNEEIYYKRSIDYSKYDDSDDIWREEDIRKYSKWKEKRGDSKVEVDCDYIPMKSINGDSWITFTKYYDDWWLVIFCNPLEKGKSFMFWICDSTDSLIELKNILDNDN